METKHSNELRSWLGLEHTILSKVLVSQTEEDK